MTATIVDRLWSETSPGIRLHLDLDRDTAAVGAGSRTDDSLGAILQALFAERGMAGYKPSSRLENQCDQRLANPQDALLEGLLVRALDLEPWCPSECLGPTPRLGGELDDWAASIKEHFQRAVDKLVPRLLGVGVAGSVEIKPSRRPARTNLGCASFVLGSSTLAWQDACLPGSRLSFADARPIPQVTVVISLRGFGDGGGRVGPSAANRPVLGAYDALQRLADQLVPAHCGVKLELRPADCDEKTKIHFARLDCGPPLDRGLCLLGP